MLTVIKIGTAVLTGIDGMNRQLLYNLVQQICILKQELRWQIAVVTSGAVGIGRSNPRLQKFSIEPPTDYDVNLAIFEKQVFSAAGQTELMSEYLENFRENEEECAQLLVTEGDFHGWHGQSLKAVSKNLLKAGIVPVFNTNDALTPEQLGFTDNDQLALAVATMIEADRLIILTDVDGVYDKDSGAVIPVIIDPLECLRHVKNSGTGLGGMTSKLEVAGQAKQAGIEVFIANGQGEDILSKLAYGEKVGSHIPTA